jgi:hypothetical protein
MAKVNMHYLKEDPPTKTALMRWGYGVDGVSFYTAVTIPADSEICIKCEGTGERCFDVGNDGFEKLKTFKCENCDGSGVICIGIEEDEQ